ncbi:hypothetical protein LX82_03769 [Celeribacter halophilus]|uniref:Uncharacterized protein n=4 Tax=Celeribacter halophilus TaxID=576117 RepID=A0A1I3X616_9RHOB|nr:hypothetical protein LX82_03769 [Celeribacter halophilus]SFK15282.1 hypothetical protein SAMN04488138_14111 [Celeribacter halophilus]
MELEKPVPPRDAIIMQLNKVHSVKTIERVAAGLGETVDRIFDLAINMETEDGVIWVCGLRDESVIAFTTFGIENLRDLIEMDQE